MNYFFWNALNLTLMKLIDSDNLKCGIVDCHCQGLVYIFLLSFSWGEDIGKIVSVWVFSAADQGRKEGGGQRVRCPPPPIFLASAPAPELTEEKERKEGKKGKGGVKRKKEQKYYLFSNIRYVKKKRIFLTQPIQISEYASAAGRPINSSFSLCTALQSAKNWIKQSPN